MALPANDPYRLPDPSISSVTFPGTVINGREYWTYMQGNYFTIFSLIWSTRDSDGSRKDVTYCHQNFTGSAGTFLMKGHMYGDDAMSFSPLAQHYFISNPLTYISETPSDIILGVAHWYCDIAEADIDVASFTATSAWCTGNSLLRSCSFFGETVIKILKEICEQSWQVFFYVNGQQQLACGYMEHEPPDVADWVIEENDFIRVIRYGEIRDRKIPGVVKYGWDCRGMTPQDPKFGIWKIDTTSIFTDKDLVLENEYSAKWVDGSRADSGSYIAWDDWVLLEIEVGGKGFCIDIDETVEVHVALLALGIDSAYPENFRVHKVVLNPMTMTARLTMLKKKSWNI